MIFNAHDSLSRAVAQCNAAPASDFQKVLTNLEVVDPFFDGIKAVQCLRAAVTEHCGGQQQHDASAIDEAKWEALAAECHAILSRYGDEAATESLEAGSRKQGGCGGGGGGDGGGGEEVLTSEVLQNVLSFDEPLSALDSSEASHLFLGAASSHASADASSSPRAAHEARGKSKSSMSVFRAHMKKVERISQETATRLNDSKASDKQSPSSSASIELFQPSQTPALHSLSNCGERPFTQCFASASIPAAERRVFVDAMEDLLLRSPEVVTQFLDWQVLVRECVYCAMSTRDMPTTEKRHMAVCDRYFDLADGKERCCILFSVMCCAVSSGPNGSQGDDPTLVESVLRMLRTLPQEWFGLTEDETTELLRVTLHCFIASNIDACSRVDPAALWLQTWVSARFSMEMILADASRELVAVLNAFSQPNLHVISLSAIILPPAVKGRCPPNDLLALADRLVLFLKTPVPEAAQGDESVALLVVRSLHRSLSCPAELHGPLFEQCVPQIMECAQGVACNDGRTAAGRLALLLLSLLATSETVVKRLPAAQLTSLDDVLSRNLLDDAEEQAPLEWPLLLRFRPQDLPHLTTAVIRAATGRAPHPRHTAALLQLSDSVYGWRKVRESLVSVSQTDTDPSTSRCTSLDTRFCERVLNQLLGLTENATTEVGSYSPSPQPRLLQRWCTWAPLREAFGLIAADAVRAEMRGSLHCGADAAVAESRKWKLLISPSWCGGDADESPRVACYQRLLLWLAQFPETSGSTETPVYTETVLVDQFIAQYARGTGTEDHDGVAGTAAGALDADDALLLLRVLKLRLCAAPDSLRRWQTSQARASLAACVEGMACTLSDGGATSSVGCDPIGVLLAQLLIESSPQRTPAGDGLLSVVWDGFECSSDLAELARAASAETGEDATTLSIDVDMARDIARNVFERDDPPLVQAVACLLRTHRGDVERASEQVRRQGWEQWTRLGSLSTEEECLAVAEEMESQDTLDRLRHAQVDWCYFAQVILYRVWQLLSDGTSFASTSLEFFLAHGYNAWRKELANKLVQYLCECHEHLETTDLVQLDDPAHESWIFPSCTTVAALLGHFTWD